jgi:integrase
MHIRQRTLEDGELEALLKACDDCLGLNKFYSKLAIELAISTAMRQDEIFNLRWKDIDGIERTIKITKSKTDHINAKKGLPPGRTIVLPLRAKTILATVILRKREDNRFQPNNFIFPSGKNLGKYPHSLMHVSGNWSISPKYAFRQVWADVRSRANIAYINGEILQFKDLRKVARRRFEEADLNETEVKIMMGHAFKDMEKVYLDRHALLIKLKRIRDKLDIRELGMTMDDLMTKRNELAKEEAKAIGIDITDYDAKGMAKALAAIKELFKDVQF